MADTNVLPKEQSRIPVGVMSLHIIWHLKTYGSGSAQEILSSWIHDQSAARRRLPSYGSMQSALRTVERSGRIYRSTRGMWELTPAKEVAERRQPPRTSGSNEALEKLRRSARQVTGSYQPQVDLSRPGAFLDDDFDTPNSMLD